MKKEFSKQQIKILIGLGLTQVQSILYLTTWQHGLLSVLELSRLTKISRQQVYEGTEKLIEMGLLETTRKNRKKFIAANPQKLLEFGQHRLQQSQEVIDHLSQSLPSILALAQTKKPKILTLYYEGVEKVKEAYAKELKESKKTEVLSFVGSIEDIFNFLPEAYWAKWNKQFVRQGSQSRMLVHNSITAQKYSEFDKAHKRETRYLNNFSLKINIDVFNNVVLLSSFYDEFAIWVESPVLAQSYRILFDSLWIHAKSFS